MQEKLFRVFVVDDDESIQRALKRLLRSEGYHVLTFSSAEDFLQSGVVLGKSCLVLDVRLPGMSGFDLQERLCSLEERHPVIFITAHDNPRWEKRSKALGAIAYLRKPFEQEPFLDAVLICRQQEMGELDHVPV